MSTLTWITGKELEREVNNNGDQFRCKKNMKLYSGGEKMRSIEKKKQSEQEHKHFLHKTCK